MDTTGYLILKSIWEGGWRRFTELNFAFFHSVNQFWSFLCTRLGRFPNNSTGTPGGGGSLPKLFWELEAFSRIFRVYFNSGVIRIIYYTITVYIKITVIIGYWILVYFLGTRPIRITELKQKTQNDSVIYLLTIITYFPCSDAPTLI